MKKITTLLVAVFTVVTINAQELKGKLASNIIKVFKDKLIITGYKYKGTKATFVAYSYDKNLKQIKEYSKELPFASDEVKGYQMWNGNLLMVWMKNKPTGYELKITDELEEISFFEKTEANVKSDVIDKDHVLLYGFQLGLEGDPYGMGKGMGVWGGARMNDINNVRFLKNDILEFDRKTGLASRYKLNETKIDPTYSPLWQTKISDNKKIKLTGFSYIDDETTIGCFIIDDGDWKDNVCKLDSKTGKVQYLTEATFPDEKEKFFISNTYYDKAKDVLIVAGQLFAIQKGKDRYNAIGVMAYDKSGKLINSQKILYPEYTTELPRKFNTDDKTAGKVTIGKNEQGNYFITCANIASYVVSNASKDGGTSTTVYQPIGFSYYELDKNLIVLNSNFTEMNDYSKATKEEEGKVKEQTIDYFGTSGDGKNIFISKLSKEKTEIIKAYDITGKGAEPTIVATINDFPARARFYTGDHINEFYSIVIEDKIFYVYKSGDSGRNEYEIKSLINK